MLMCRDLAVIASDYLEGDLPLTQRLSVRTHLMMCRHCRSFIANLRNSIELMKGHSDQRLDDRYARRLDEEIERALASQSKDGSGPDQG
ncbi:zf-HC2 domain-containing protein [Marinobacter xestospongiae]|uniref:Zf-HC2 domain-containing protein n=1 Tax=Marinobacter xestospongiae TaxID=994319 RepID=A0ABU3W223_9GAMM|nr:zf-HC2 domain-containing protein [Marinobacter xestospongiae]MDV2080587.1 zf-HC2 domain-containing protein [Marinobacter xestospongiae]